MKLGLADHRVDQPGQVGFNNTALYSVDMVDWHKFCIETSCMWIDLTFSGYEEPTDGQKNILSIDVTCSGKEKEKSGYVETRFVKCTKISEELQKRLLETSALVAWTALRCSSSLTAKLKETLS